jgi:hypothetical protein
MLRRIFREVVSRTADTGAIGWLRWLVSWLVTIAIAFAVAATLVAVDLFSRQQIVEVTLAVATGLLAARLVYRGVWRLVRRTPDSCSS